MRHNFLLYVGSFIFVEFFTPGDVNSTLGVPVTGKKICEGCSIGSILGQIACICTEYHGSAGIIEWFAAILEHVPGTS